MSKKAFKFEFQTKFYLSSSELNRCLSDGIDKSRVPFGTGGKLELASKFFFRPFLSFSFSSSSESLSLESLESSRISDTSDVVESDSGKDEVGGDVGNGRIGTEVVRGGNGGGAFSSSLSLPVAISKLSSSLKVYNNSKFNQTFLTTFFLLTSLFILFIPSTMAS